MAQDMKEFLDAFRSARGWSLKEMALRLGYGSATSLVRLEQNKTSLENLLRFARLMHQCEDMQLTPEEGQALDMMLERRQLTDDAYHATLLLHSLLRNETQPDLPLTVRMNTNGAELTLKEYLATRRALSVVIFNCLDMPIFGGLAEVVRSFGIRAEHYLTTDEQAAHTVQRVLRVLPLTYLNGYSAYTMRLHEDQPSGVLRADMMVCQIEQNGQPYMDVLIANSLNRMDCHTIPGTLPDTLRVILPSGISIKPCGDYRLRQAHDYVEYLQLCCEMERDHEVMRIKPDFGLDQIPPEIMLSAVQDQMQQLPEVQQAVAGSLDALFALISERYQNYCAKHQPQYHVYKKQAMWHFVKTGQLSDHAWLLRPFTVQERLAILQSTAELLRRNPYLHITFLKNETDFRNDEIIYYEGTGVSIIKPETDYNLHGSHRESLVSQEKFMHVYHAFFLNSIIAMHTMTEKQAMGELEAMMTYLRNQL